MRTILNVSKKLFSAWNELGICYCHWKSNEHLYEGLVGETDLDVLVSLSDKEKAEEVLKIQRFIKMRPQFGSRYLDVDDWVACDVDTGKMIHVHLHYTMITGHKGLKEYTLPWTEKALSTRILEEEFSVYIATPSLEMVILLTRIALKATCLKNIRATLGRYKISDDILEEICYLKRRVSEKEIEEIVNLQFGKDAKDFIHLIYTENYNAVWFKRLRKIVKKHFAQYNQCTCTLMQRLYYYVAIHGRILLKKKMAINLITRKTVPHGLIVAFIGQDGAGKSTVSDEVCKWLCWKIDSARFYLGSGEHYKSIPKTLRTKLNKNTKVGRILCDFLTVCDLMKISKCTYRKVRKARKYANKGGIAVFDRYPQLSFEGINDGPKIRFNARSKKRSTLINKFVSMSAKVEEKYLKKAVAIQPDLVFKLILPPEVSLQRKPEESFENVKKKHEIIKALQFETAETVVIDATKEYAEEIRLIHNIIWEYLLNHQEYFFSGLD